MTKLHLDGICHEFDGKDLFVGLDLSVQKGDVVAIVGTSGVGKTTLFNIASGLIMPKSGRVCIDGVETTGQAGHVGYMLQKDLLLPFKSVYDNIALPLTLKKQDKSTIYNAIMPKLQQFGLDGLHHKYPQQLSGGQRQRVALLRTYLSNSELMLLDEPFSALDYVTKHQMYAWFDDFRQKVGLTCLIITHDIEEAMNLANCVYVLRGFPASLSKPFVIPKSPQFAQSAEFLVLKGEILAHMHPSFDFKENDEKVNYF